MKQSNNQKTLFLVLRATGTKEEMVVNAFETYKPAAEAIKDTKYLKVRMTQMTPIAAWNTMRRLGKIS